MTSNETLELPKNTRLRSIFDENEATIYLFDKLKSVNNIVHAFVQKIDGNNIEIIKFPLNYFQNEFIKYVPLVIHIEKDKMIEEIPKLIVEEIDTPEVGKKIKK